MAAAEVNTPPAPTTGTPPVAAALMPAARGARSPTWGRKVRKFFMQVVRITLTLGMVALAAAVGYSLWEEYRAYPWTRDGQVQADVVGIAARVSGPMIAVHVKDNEFVHKGELLFEIDPSTFAAEVASYQAQLALAQAKTIESQREAERRKELVAQQFVSIEDYQQANARYKEDYATEKEIEAELNLANLNLTYTKVISPVNGYITNMHLAVGTYVTEGQPLMALLDTDSYYVYGFFPETELSHIAIGDTAVVEMMDYDGQRIDGNVTGIGWAIYQENGAAQNLLPNVSPTIDWVLLAQRFPVRVKLKYVPNDVHLRAGQTVSVIVLKSGDTGKFVPWWTW